MTFCGYNPTMAKGLRTFAEGMVLAMEERHSKGVSMPDVVRSELIDLARMNEVLKAGETTLELDALMAINCFAQAVFTAAAPQAGSAPEFRKACLAFADQFVALVKETEDQHQFELGARESMSGDVAAIEAVARWLQALPPPQGAMAAAE